MTDTAEYQYCMVCLFLLVLNDLSPVMGSWGGGMLQLLQGEEELGRR